MNLGVVQVPAMIQLILEPAEGELELIPQFMGFAVMLFRGRGSSHCE